MWSYHIHYFKDYEIAEASPYDDYVYGPEGHFSVAQTISRHTWKISELFYSIRAEDESLSSKPTPNSPKVEVRLSSSVKGGERGALTLPKA